MRIVQRCEAASGLRSVTIRKGRLEYYQHPPRGPWPLARRCQREDSTRHWPVAFSEALSSTLDWREE